METILADAVYTLGRDPAEHARLQRQSDDLRAHALALLEHVHLEEGDSAIDIGCGPSGVLDLLSQRVGRTGSVVGLEVDAGHAALAREFATTRGLSNVRIVQGDARRSRLPASSFDVAHARLVLITIPDPAHVVAEMARLVRPGGWIAGEEVDLVTLGCQPSHPAWDRLVELLLTVWRQDGADPHLGRRLPELYRAAGLVDVEVEVRAEMYPVGHPRRMVHADLVRSMRPKIVERGLAGEPELDDLDRAVREHIGDPRTLIMPHLYFLAWGRKPTV